MRAWLVGVVLGVAAGCAPVVAGNSGSASGGRWREQAAMIPLREADGGVVNLVGRVCRPAGETPGRVVVIAHGSPAVAAERQTQRLAQCDSEAVRWFLERGDVVVLSLRRGYGETGGAYAEGSPQCETAAYAHAARESARDVMATVAYGLALPFARHEGAVVVGQSAGGWAAMGVAAGPHPGVVAIVSMAGGRGGHMGNRPNNNCRPDHLAEAAGILGRTADMPMLWIYTENDSFFAPSIASELHRAWTGAGGKAELVALPAYGRDGHGLFFGRGGASIWGPPMGRYLAQQGAG